MSNTKLCATKTRTSKSINLYPRWVFEDGLFVAKCKIMCNKQKPIFTIHLGFFVAWFCIPGGFWRWIFVAKYKIMCNKKTHLQKFILGFCCIILYPRWVLKRGFLLCTIFYLALSKRGVCIVWVLVRLLVIPTAVLFSQQLLGCSLRLGLASFAHGMG